MESMTNLSRYPGSSIYPVDDSAIKSIAANMAANGYDPDFPILLKDGAIVDGWHRCEAAKLAGVEPIFREFDGNNDDAVRFVLRANGDRRHLGAGQRAAASVLAQRKLGLDAEKIADLAESQGFAVSTYNQYASYPAEDLEDIVKGAKTQTEVKKRNKKGPPQRNPTYTLTKAQAAKVASLSINLDDRGKNILRRAFDMGLKALEDSLPAANGK